MKAPQHYSLLHPVYWLCTWGHCGLSPKAPGTVGSLVALPYAALLYHKTGLLGLCIASVTAFIIGWYCSERYVQRTQRQDPKEVVIDEVAGMWLTLALVIAFMPFAVGQMGGMWQTTLWMTLPAFGFFRLFDIFKPWPISWCDKHIKGGLGIMLDDIIAAFPAAFCVWLLQHLALALGLI